MSEQKDIKPVTLKMRDLLDRLAAIESLLVAREIKMKMASQISKLTAQVVALVREHERNRNKRLREVMEENEKTGRMEIPPEKRKDWQKEVEEALDAEVVIQAAPIGLPGDFKLVVPEEPTVGPDGQKINPPSLGLIGLLTNWPEFFFEQK